jgi:hypothetical protein
MMQQQAEKKKQNVHQSATQRTAKPKVSPRVTNHPYVQEQGLIGNHGVLHRYGSDVIQAKLIVGAPNGKYEREAVRLAEDVTRMTGAGLVGEAANRAAMSGRLQAGLEALSGMDLSGIRVHTNATKPAQLHALAYTQGQDIYVGPGQEQHLPHEGWHAVQQMQGRVKPTMQAKGVSINDDASLEREADVMGAKALQMKGAERATTGPAPWGFMPLHREVVTEGGSAVLGKAIGTSEEEGCLNFLSTEDLLPRGAKVSVGSSAQQERFPLIVRLRDMLGPERKGASRPIQFALKESLRGMLDIIGPPHYEGVIRAIRAAPVSERQAVLNDAPTMSLIRSRFSGVYATTIMSSLLEGSQTWTNPPATDFYSFFVLRNGQGTRPSFSATMNCWESIMYAAYLAGVLSASWIKSYYVTARAVPGTTVNPTPALWAQLGFSTSLPQYAPTARPPRVPTVGQLVFYLPTGATIPSHVAIFMGGTDVISLWTQPAGIRRIQRVLITSFAGTIYFGNAPW